MAESATEFEGTTSRGHLECPICCCHFTDPKILDCLHSFCLNCLVDLVSSQPHKTDKITCPVCRRVTAVPDTGLQGLTNCFFLSSLFDEINKQEQLLGDAPTDTLTCEECDEGLEAVSRCLDCDGHICQNCLDMHRKIKTLKKHRTVSLDQSSDEVPSRKEDVPQCKKHTNQELCIYCETCETLACGKCAALDHRTAKHEYREVADAMRPYRQDVDEILQRFDKSRDKLKAADDLLRHARNRLRHMISRACTDITIKEKEEIAKIRNKSHLLRGRVRQIGDERDQRFEVVQKSNSAKMERAEQIVATVNELMRQADDFQLLDLKPDLMHNLLEFHKELEFEQAQYDLSFIDVKCQDVVADAELGKVLQEGKWRLKAGFNNWGPDNTELGCIAGVACLSNGDIAVTDIGEVRFMIFTSTGEYKRSVGREKLNLPTRVAATADDLLLVIDDVKHVKVFDSSLKFIRQFTPSESDEDSVSESDLTGIAVDERNRIAVADRGRKVISLHNMDGSLISTIPSRVINGNLAFGIKDRLIFTNYPEGKLICTTSTRDEVFHVNTSSVCPSSVCCDETGDIYVSVNFAEREGGEVHHYSPGGAFIEIISDAMALRNYYNCDLTCSPNGDIIVADGSTVIILQRV